MIDPIVCEPRRDVFLAVTEIMPLEPEPPRKSSEEIKKAREQLINALYNCENIKFDIGGSIEEKRTLNEVFLQDGQNEQEQEKIDKEHEISLHLKK